MDSNAQDKKPREKSKNCKFLTVGDPYMRKQIEDLVKPPTDPTNFIFWESKPGSEEYPDGGWGLTIKQMPLKEGKKNSGQHTWKVTWYYDEKTQTLKAARHSLSLVKDVSGKEAQQIVEIYNCYRKA